MQTYTKQQLIERLRDIKRSGWVCCARPGNVGGIGNTLEDLLGIKENNLPIPNANEWELKTQRLGTSSLTTLFHIEPSPRALKFVPQIFLLKYGWAHKEAGNLYGVNEMSFRQTIHGGSRSDRGFKVVIDRKAEKVLISFDSSVVDTRHKAWLKSVKDRVGLGELNLQPYWGFRDLAAKAGSKLLNCFYVQAVTKKDEQGRLCYHYNKILMCETFSFENFLKALESAKVLVDFDARTGHNHGTKFRLRQDKLPELYARVTEIE